MSFEAEVDALRLEDMTLLSVRCPDSAIFIGRRGVGLDALELVIARMLERRLPEPTGEARRVVVDSEDYRARRHLGLLQKTYVMAGEALAAMRPQSIPQLSAAERHLVRAALKPVSGLRTGSAGAGALRNVTIVPTGHGDEDGDREEDESADSEGDRAPFRDGGRDGDGER
jgi:spoIIIJ-associated protein